MGKKRRIINKKSNVSFKLFECLAVSCHVSWIREESSTNTDKEPGSTIHCKEGVLWISWVRLIWWKSPLVVEMSNYIRSGFFTHAYTYTFNWMKGWGHPLVRGGIVRNWRPPYLCTPTPVRCSDFLPMQVQDFPYSVISSGPGQVLQGWPCLTKQKAQYKAPSLKCVPCSPSKNCPHPDSWLSPSSA